MKMLMFTILLGSTLSAAGATSPPSTPADDWRPYAANPAYEVFGHADASGVFRYTKSRKAEGPKPAPVVNYGVNLSPAASIGAPVSGTDVEAGRALQEATARASANSMGQGDAGPMARGDSAGDAAGDCPNGRRCPRPPPTPPEAFPHPFRDIAALPDIGWWIVGVIVVGFGFIVICLLILALVIWARK